MFNAKSKNLWLNLNSSLWFVPTLIVFVAAGLAILFIYMDATGDFAALTDNEFLFGAGAAGARGMLGAIGSSMITVAGLIFSLTISTLAQASSQYTPRILRNFMRDKANQVVLGFFVGVFVYSLIVLRTIRGGDEGAFVPKLSVAFGLVLALSSIFVLIYFIHHVASSLQATTIIESAARETSEAIDKLFPSTTGREADDDDDKAVASHNLDRLTWHAVKADTSGYIFDFDGEALLKLARENDWVIRMTRGVGSFVARHSTLAEVAAYKDGVLINEKLATQINELFALDSYRSIEKDIGFGLRQIVDIALKALSPGINDTTTAIQAIDRLGALVAELATRRFNRNARTDETINDNRVRVITVTPTFEDYVRTAFDQIRTSGANNVAVMRRLLSAYEIAVEQVEVRSRREVLARQIALTLEAAERTIKSDYEKQQVREQAERLQRATQMPFR